MAITPNGDYAYVTAWAPGADRIYEYGLNPTTGEIRTLANPDYVTSLYEAGSVTVCPNSKYVYVNSGSAGEIQAL